MKNTKGFTLIELLVVITIIAILAVGAVQVFNVSQQRARDAVRISDLGTMASAIEIFNADNSSYPNNNGTGATDTAALETDLEGNYLQALPASTGSPNQYHYAVNTSDGTGTPSSYEILVQLEAGTNDGVESGDGGSQTDHYEKGSDMTLITGASGGATGTPETAAANNMVVF